MCRCTCAFFLLALSLGSNYAFRINDKDISRLLDGVQSKDATTWVLLVAGSNGYDNYRHQSDICHAYHVVSSHGIPDEKIIVMMYDDIAYNQDNPTQGIIINRPNGPDVYKGVPKDYTGDDVSSDNFLKILTGDEEAMAGIGSGRVIKSGPNDYVFVNFVDHGSQGLILFPNDNLYSVDLNDAIKKMHQDNKYGEMVFYVEACESGSMFKNLLPNDINVYATTAANSHESSYACYYDDVLSTYLGDVYSVNWMADSETSNLQKETLQQQYLTVKRETTNSHVMQYGQLSISTVDVGEFQGHKQPEQQNFTKSVITDAVPSPDVPKAILQRKLEAAKDEKTRHELRQKLHDLEGGRKFLSDTMRKIIITVTQDETLADYVLSKKMLIKNHICHKSVTQYFSKKCFNLSQNAHGLRHVYVLVNMCEYGYSADVLKQAMDSVCIHTAIKGIN